MSVRQIPRIGRLVVKVGTSSLVDDTGSIASRKLANVVRDVAAVVEGGRSCVLVTSGAIASGLGPLGLPRRPSRLPALQAAAAVGQGRLMAEYAGRFERRGLVAAQVLLTREDFGRRRQFVNAQRTFDHLLSGGAIPVVNENDAVATDEITFGDNDRLAALVALMAGADLLVLLSDVDGVYTADPRRPGAERGRLVPELVDASSFDARGPGSAFGSGGMASKLEAAGLAAAAGIPTVIARASGRDVLARILAGDPVGTWIPARGRRPRARKAWMAFATVPSGRILVDAGATRAVRDSGRSLLAAGVVGVEGRFGAGDTVEVIGPDGRPFARGIVNYSADEVRRLAGRGTGQGKLTSWSGGRALPTRPVAIAQRSNGEVIHRDGLVVLEAGA